MPAKLRGTTWVMIICTGILFYKCAPYWANPEYKPNAPTARETPAPTPKETFNIAIAQSSSRFKTEDWNNDGKYNCIDACLIFKQYYPEADIMYVQSRTRKTAHLYIQIGQRVVEPQDPRGSSTLKHDEPEPYDTSGAVVKTVADVYAGRW
jgi:hypothetical protein